MKNNNITTIINDITPKKEVLFGAVIETIFNSYREINKDYNHSNVKLSDIDDLNFNDWFSLN